MLELYRYPVLCTHKGEATAAAGLAPVGTPISPLVGEAGTAWRLVASLGCQICVSLGDGRVVNHSARGAEGRAQAEAGKVGSRLYYQIWKICPDHL